MKIPRAIEILTTHQASLSMDYTPDLRDAIKLGIEALKAIEGYRKLPFYRSLQELPGETEG